VPETPSGGVTIALVGIHIEKVDLPGIGIRHDLVTEGGRKISVVSHRDGERDLGVFDVDDPDACRDSIPLNDDEAAALADVLGASVMLSRLTSLSDETAGLYTEQIALPTDSPYLNRTLGDTKARTRTHASIVAIVRDKEIIPSPTPAEPLRAGDVIVAVGTREGLDGVARLLSNGPG
jgi:TrkA domain protein